MTPFDLETRIREQRDRIDAATGAAGRPAGSVALMLATKTQSTERTLEAIRAGGTLLGESRAQEITAKGPALVEAGVHPSVHLIGHLQSNKVNQVLPWVTCIETIDSLRLATRVAARCVEADQTMDVFVQVNSSGEDSKFGVTPDDAPAFAEAIGALDGLRLRGFMTIGANSTEERVVRGAYARLREVRDDVLGSGAPGTVEATELSMGMSRSLEDAIAEGATIVRVGTAVFGPRPA